MLLEKIYHLYQESNGISTDTRSIVKAQLFFALKGENFNGNKYVAEAQEKSDYYCIVDEETAVLNDRCIRVPDVLQTLQNLALHHRKQITYPVISITGSNGKTTTKELTAAVLSKKYNVHYTQGNLNNHIGVPLTILAAPKDTELMIVEMGANHQGEIEMLCDIAHPDYGVITNVGKAHLEGFGGVEGVIKGKTEMYRYLGRSNGIVLINGEDQTLMQHLPSHILSYKFFPSDYKVKFDEHQFVKIIEPNGKEISTELIGDYNKVNILIALEFGKIFNVDAQSAQTAIASYVPKMNRSQKKIIGNNTFYLDAYNANPTSVLHSVRSFDNSVDQLKIVVLGDMLELGDESDKEHQEILHQIAALEDIKEIWLVGHHFNKQIKPANAKSFKDVSELINWYSNGKPLENTHFLIKGSRGIRLEKFVESIA